MHACLKLTGFFIYKKNSRDGAAIEPRWEPPVYAGPDPEPSGAGFENGEVYRGSCRCGAVQAAVKMPGPLDASYKGPVLECNCSICQRVRSLHPRLRTILRPAPG